MKHYVGTHDDWPFVEGWHAGLDGADPRENPYYGADLYAWDRGRVIARDLLGSLQAPVGGLG